MTLLDDTRPAGAGTVSFDASRLAPGVYLYQLRAGKLSDSRSMLVLR
jgi:hypothetical protein